MRLTNHMLTRPEIFDHVSARFTSTAVRGDKVVAHITMSSLTEHAATAELKASQKSKPSAGKAERFYAVANAPVGSIVAVAGERVKVRETNKDLDSGQAFLVKQTTRRDVVGDSPNRLALTERIRSAQLIDGVKIISARHGAQAGTTRGIPAFPIADRRSLRNDVATEIVRLRTPVGGIQPDGAEITRQVQSLTFERPTRSPDGKTRTQAFRSPAGDASGKVTSTLADGKWTHAIEFNPDTPVVFGLPMQ